ncbi:MAG: hypothetical protein GY805_21735 [Chloroflexi bacterium]|nr:hypothetical protein [Chloroflexota bacterium]
MGNATPRKCCFCVRHGKGAGCLSEPYHPLRPVVCFDEATKQLIRELRAPLPMQPRQAQRYDYEYERLGTVNLFLFCEPLAGWRHIEVTPRRTALDFAACMK